MAWWDVITNNPVTDNPLVRGVSNVGGFLGDVVGAAVGGALDVGGRVLSTPQAALPSFMEAASSSLPAASGKGTAKTVGEGITERAWSPEARFGYSIGHEMAPDSPWYTQMAIDMVLDPLNVVPGVPAAKAGAKAGGKAAKAGGKAAKTAGTKVQATVDGVFDQAAAMVDRANPFIQADLATLGAGTSRGGEINSATFRLPQHMAMSNIDDVGDAGRGGRGGGRGGDRDKIPSDPDEREAYFEELGREESPFETMQRKVEGRRKEKEYDPHYPAITNKTKNPDFEGQVMADIDRVAPNITVEKPDKTIYTDDEAVKRLSYIFGNESVLRQAQDVVLGDALTDITHHGLSERVFDEFNRSARVNTQDPVTQRSYEVMNAHLRKLVDQARGVIDITPMSDFNLYDSNMSMLGDIVNNRQLRVPPSSLYEGDDVPPLLADEEALRAAYLLSHITYNDPTRPSRVTSFTSPGSSEYALRNLMHNSPTQAWPALINELGIPILRNDYLQETNDFFSNHLGLPYRLANYYPQNVANIASPYTAAHVLQNLALDSTNRNRFWGYDLQNLSTSGETGEYLAPWWQHMGQSNDPRSLADIWNPNLSVGENVSTSTDSIIRKLIELIETENAGQAESLFSVPQVGDAERYNIPFFALFNRESTPYDVVPGYMNRYSSLIPYHALSGRFRALSNDFLDVAGLPHFRQ